MKTTEEGCSSVRQEKMKHSQPNLQEDGVCHSKESALENSVVLNNLFGLLNEKDIRSCRLVKTAWNLEAVSILKKKSKHIDLYGDSHDNSTIFRFMDCVQSSPDFPFTKIYLRTNFHTIPVATWNVVLRFVAPWVTSLYICGSGIVLPLPAGITFPKLSDFDISCPDHSFVVQLVTNAPLLTSFRILHPEKETLLALCQIPTLRLSQLRLLGYGQDTASLKAAKDFFKSQEETLTDLTVFSYTYAKKDGFQAVTLKNLKRLNLGCFYSYGKPVEAGIPFPALTKFIMYSDDGHLTKKDFMNLSNGQPLTSVQNVYFGSSLSHQSLQVHVIVPMLFPNVKCLSIPTSIDNLLLLIGNLTNLNELELLDYDHNCSFARLYSQLTGIPETQEKTASKFSAREISKMKKDFAANLKRMPCSALEKIQRLKLHCGKSELNDCELLCRMIFNQLENLKKLHINIWQEKNTYQECLSMLTKGMKAIITDMKIKFVVILT